MALLFSYGTLQNKTVQIRTFGRELGGSQDILPGYKIEMIRIGSADVVDLSGEKNHPIARPGNDKDEVAGMVFEITDAELQNCDHYEVDDYKRVLKKLKSGRSAWVYVAA